MKIGIATIGSRGDVQPFIALALGLKERGHEVALMAPENFSEMVTAFGIRMIPLSMNPEQSIRDPRILNLLKKGSIIRFARTIQKVSAEHAPVVNGELARACPEFDALIASSLTAFSITSIAERYNKQPAYVFLSMPITPTAKFPHCMFGDMNFGSLNRTSYVINPLIWLTIRRLHLGFRARLGLPPKNLMRELTSGRSLTIYPMSKYLQMQPADWPDRVRVTGFLKIPEKYSERLGAELPSEALEAWMHEGEKPVYMGFGSMPIPDTEKWKALLTELLTQTTHRILFCKGWTAIEGLPAHPRLFVVSAVDHQVVLPRCKAAVIHGGMGTTAAVMEAGIPALILSFLADQPYTGRMVERKKIGKHLPFKKLNTTRMISGLEDILTDKIVNNARQLGILLNKEDGVSECVRLIEEYFSLPAPSL